MQCDYFDAGRCRSCALMGVPYAVQLAEKLERCQRALASVAPDVTWLEPFPSRESAFRNKAKLVVGGRTGAVTVGILDPESSGVDLRACGLHEEPLQRLIPRLADAVDAIGLEPYDVKARRGELKHLILTRSPAGDVMLRFVLRSKRHLALLESRLPRLLEHLSEVRVVSVNLQPEHKAVLEGDREILLTEQETLTMRIAGLDLHLRPQSFFQTNTAMAAELYERGRSWAREVGPATAWDLYCGVGGFALAIAGTGVDVTGIEVSTEAVASATLSAAEAGLDRARFEAGDATAYAATSTAPELVVVNPPRRGIGPELSGWLEASGAGHVLYSSCHAQTLARDLAAMPSLRPVRGQLLDMFPNTGHYEVLTLLERR